MPVKVKCTSCHEEMMLPDGAAGKQFSCPRCRAKFSVSGNTASISGSVSMKAPPSPPPAPGAGSITASHSDEELASYIDGDEGPPTQATRGATTALTQSRSSVAVPTTPPADPTTQSTSARFIIADATARRLELGASGQLPALVLDETKKKEPEEKPEGSKPWVLIAVVLGSVLLSVAMLFFDTAGFVGESGDKGAARRNIEKRYVQQIPSSRPCQPYLARAIQAYNRGDSAEERRLYRRVLDMLHSEGKDPNEGVTGAIQSDSLPNDKELEELISTLLRE